MSELGIAAKFRERAARRGYATAPIKSKGMPPGIPYIVVNEAAERFSFYGMRSILVIFMTQYMLDAHGQPAHFSGIRATIWFHNFMAATYFLPILGGIIADAFLGKFVTVISLSLVYCAGHAALAINDTRDGLILGLTLIAFGAGGIKPCVSAIVGDQFGPSNQHLLSKVFSWFYFSINLGSAVALILIPKILENHTAIHGSHYAFALPGVLMFVATVAFWLGRKKFVHVPPGGLEFLRETFSVESLRIMGRLAVLYVLVSLFWALFEQSSSTWVLQAQKMDRHIFGFELLATQLQALNPIFILVLIPIFSYAIYPAINRVFPLTPLRKIGIGYFVSIPSFLIPAWVESQIGQGHQPTILWQVLSYLLITAAEVLISITCLEFAYTQAPKRMKSLVMSFYLASIALGDKFVSVVNQFVLNPDGSSKLAGANYYLFFAGVTFVAAAGFVVLAVNYKVQTFLEDEAPVTGGL